MIWTNAWMVIWLYDTIWHNTLGINELNAVNTTVFKPEET